LGFWGFARRVELVQARGQGVVPDGHADGHGDVEGMLGAELGDLEASVAEVHDLLVHAVDLVAEDEGVGPARLGAEVAQGRGGLGLLEGQDGVAFGAQSLDGLGGLGDGGPGHGVGCAQGGLADFLVGRGGREPAEQQAPEAEGVGGPEGGADVVAAAEVVEHQGQGQGGQQGVLFEAGPPEFGVGELGVAHFGQGWGGWKSRHRPPRRNRNFGRNRKRKGSLGTRAGAGALACRKMLTFKAIEKTPQS